MKSSSRDVPRPPLQFTAIWLMAAVGELLVVRRALDSLGWMGRAREAPLTGMLWVWTVIALIGIPVAAWFVTRLLRREYEHASDADDGDGR